MAQQPLHQRGLQLPGNWSPSGTARHAETTPALHAGIGCVHGIYLGLHVLWREPRCMCVCVCVRACVCASCVRACVRVCVCVCARARARARAYIHPHIQAKIP